MRPITVFLLISMLAMVSAGLEAQQPPPPAGLNPAAKAGEEGGSAPVEARRVAFPNLGVTVDEEKRLDPLTGEVTGSAFDVQGRSVDVAVLRDLEVQARLLTPRAKLHRDLAEALDTADPDALIPVVAWLVYDGAALDAHAHGIYESLGADEERREAVRAAEAAIADFAMARNAETTAPFVEVLQAMGISLRLVSITAPAVFFDASPAQVLDLAALPMVDTLYLEQATGGYSNSDANDSHRTYRVHQMGVKGKGIRVSNIGGRIDDQNPYMNVVAAFRPQDTPGGHGTQVGGCIASRHPDRLGASPDVDLYSANPQGISDAWITAAGDWIILQNLDATNMSFYQYQDDQIHYLDRYFDYQSRVFADSYVTAAGNFGNGSGYVVTPSKGWNAITVGNFNDSGNGDWIGDSMAGSSSFVNPVTGCEKPNVSANGTNVQTLDLAPGNLSGGVTGTSYASPHCLGNLANAMMVDSTLIVYPEASMALMMATAWHNIEGASRLSGIDGAGGIVGLAAVRQARNAIGTTLTPASFSNNGYYTRNIYLRGGDRARVCIAWGATADSSYAVSTLNADLDLAVLSGQGQTSGTFFGSSLSFNNNFEIVEFTPPASGWYTLRINDYAFALASERLGIAWSQKYADTSSARLREVTDVTSPLGGPTLGNPNYGMHVDARNSAGRLYVAWPSGSQIGGFNFSPNTWEPLDLDVWFDIWLDDATSGAWFWTAPLGILDSSGQSTAFSMEIPSWGFLAHYPLHHIMATVDAAAPYDSISEISEVHTFDFWTPGITKPLSDDGSFVQPLPFGFTFYGNTYNQCWVNMNGNITFGGPDSDFSPTAAEMILGLPRIAFLWRDLNPAGTGGQGAPMVKVREIFGGPAGNQKVVIEFVNVPQYNVPTSHNTVRITLSDDNRIGIEYLDCTAADCIVGISPGGALSSASSINLTSSGEHSGASGNEAIFEDFSGCGPVPIFCDNLDLDSTNGYWNQIEFRRYFPSILQTPRYRLHVDVE